MLGSLSALSPMEIALVTVAVVGCVPVAIQYRKRSRWFALGYAMLVAAAVSTNVEGLVLPTVFNYAEHGVGLMGAGIAFFLAAYVHRREITAPEESGRRDLTASEEVSHDG